MIEKNGADQGKIFGPKRAGVSKERKTAEL